MLKHLIPIDEVLFVFGCWTLMGSQKDFFLLLPGDYINLFDINKKKIGKAKLNRFLPSRNYKISPMEISVIEIHENMKNVKFIQKTIDDDT